MAVDYFEAGNDKNDKNKIFWLPTFSSCLEIKFKAHVPLGIKMVKIISIVSLLFTAHLSTKFNNKKYSCGTERSRCRFQMNVKITDSKQERSVLFTMFRIKWLKTLQFYQPAARSNGNH
jgi:hypothetical protein